MKTKSKWTYFDSKLNKRVQLGKSSFLKGVTRYFTYEEAIILLKEYDTIIDNERIKKAIKTLKKEK